MNRCVVNKYAWLFPFGSDRLLVQMHSAWEVVLVSWAVLFFFFFLKIHLGPLGITAYLLLHLWLIRQGRFASVTGPPITTPTIQLGRYAISF